MRSLLPSRHEGEPTSPLSFFRNGARTVSSGQVTQMTVHIELEELRHIDNETPRPERNIGDDPRPPDFSSMKSTEARAAQAGSKGDIGSIRSTQWQQEALDQQQDAQDAQDFSRQI